MRWVLCNGSPRGPKSNTRILLGHIAAGLEATDREVVDILYLVRSRERERQLQLITAADAVLIAFPLYTDAMPGLVKQFFEDLAALPDQTHHPPLAFLVQSGFPEAAHSRPVERYLTRFTRRLGCRYLGTTVRGGVEGIQARPPWMTRRLYALMRELGMTLSETSGFDPGVLRRLAPREKMSPLRRTIFALLQRIGVGNFYWDMQLKRNDAYEDRFARPWIEPEP